MIHRWPKGLKGYLEYYSLSEKYYIVDDSFERMSENTWLLNRTEDPYMKRSPINKRALFINRRDWDNDQ